MDVFLEELKRQLNFKNLVTYVLISITLALFWVWFIVGGATEDFMQTGCYKGYKGKAAIEMAAKDRKSTEGEMTKDKFQIGCDEFLKSLKGNDETEIVMNKQLLKYCIYADKLVMQEFSIREIKGESKENLLHIKKNAGKHFYENEDLYYKSYIEKTSHNENEKKLALSIWDKVKKPYIYYSGFKIWSDGIGHLVLFSFVLMIMVGIFSGSIIAKDKESGIDEIIVTTVKGRKTLMISKIIIPWILSFIIYFCGVGIYVILLKFLLPTNALNTSMQVFQKSFIPYNLGEFLKKIFIFGGVGILTIASFSTWISSITKKSSTAISFSILTILGAFILGLLIDMDAYIVNVIKLFMPGGIIFLYPKSLQFPITTFLGKTFWIPSILIFSSTVIFLFSTVLTALNYKRR